MGSKHEKTLLEKARDELFSHIQSCNVLQATEQDQESWMAETMEYMAERYPELSELQLAQLRMFGDRYVAPAIPHGRGSSETKEEEKEEAKEEAKEDDGGDDGSDTRAA